jgi:hypothetical protein
MKVRFYHWYNALLSTLLTMLGFGSCTSVGEDEYGTPVEEYGAPSVEYLVSGTITDEAGTPLQGIQVTAPYGSIFDSQSGQIVQTDAAGGFALKEFSSMRGRNVIIEDVDGEANGGEFLSDTLNVEELPKTQIAKGEGWYVGKFEVTANVKLKKK